MNLEVLKAELRREPFEPFTMRLADGRGLVVRHPEFVAVTPRRVIVVDENDEHMHILEPLLILSFDKKMPSAAFASVTSNGSPPA